MARLGNFFVVSSSRKAALIVRFRITTFHEYHEDEVLKVSIHSSIISVRIGRHLPSKLLKYKKHKGRKNDGHRAGHRRSNSTDRHQSPDLGSHYLSDWVIFFSRLRINIISILSTAAGNSSRCRPSSRLRMKDQNIQTLFGCRKTIAVWLSLIKVLSLQGVVSCWRSLIYREVDIFTEEIFLSFSWERKSTTWSAELTA